MEQEKQAMTFAQRIASWWQNLQQTDLRAQAHYMIFRTTQQLKQKNDLLSYYKQRFMDDWLKWLGIGVGVTGLLMLLNPDGVWRWQLLWIVLAGLLAPLVADFWLGLQKLFTEYPGKQLIGQVLTLEQGIEDGKGTARVDNQTWQISGQDCPAQTQVRIIAINDQTLHVAPLNPMAE